MPITFKSGDLFAEPADALINTVNCVGVMGKGVALEFKRRWPQNFRKYKTQCDNSALKPGKLLTVELRELLSAGRPHYIINFPTKAHWRSPSKVEYIEAGLEALVEEIDRLGLKSIAMPPLGCGNGGLSWQVVRPIIERKLNNIHGVDIIVFEPHDRNDNPEFSGSSSLTMNYPRAMLLKALSELEVFFDGSFDRISMQKIVYFLQALGIDYKLQFRRNLFGPYSEALSGAFRAFEKHGLLSGYGSEDRKAKVTAEGYAAADEYLKESSQPSDSVIGRLNLLIEGYESPYGMELLSSVHWLATKDGLETSEAIAHSMSNWNERKRNLFDIASIEAAHARLIEDGLLQSVSG